MVYLNLDFYVWHILIFVLNPFEAIKCSTRSVNANSYMKLFSLHVSLANMLTNLFYCRAHVSMPSVWTVPGVILFVICKTYYFFMHLVPLYDIVAFYLRSWF